MLSLSYLFSSGRSHPLRPSLYSRPSLFYLFLSPLLISVEGSGIWMGDVNRKKYSRGAVLHIKCPLVRLVHLFYPALPFPPFASFIFFFSSFRTLSERTRTFLNKQQRFSVFVSFFAFFLVDRFLYHHSTYETPGRACDNNEK